MTNESKQSLINERYKMENRADLYRARAKYYLGILNYINELSRADEITGEDSVTLQVLHFGYEKPEDQFFIDQDLLIDLIKIQANRYWTRHDQCMSAVMKIDKILRNEN